MKKVIIFLVSGMLMLSGCGPNIKLIEKSENLNLNNITLEASGNPTYLCGLLARGQHLANKFAEKNIKYHQEDDDYPVS